MTVPHALDVVWEATTQLRDSDVFIGVGTVLDAAMIVRVGRYGNADEGVPLVKEGGLPHPNRLGGDEVALFYTAYVGVDTDRRLFIADVGNTRIVSVRLGYYIEEQIKLKETGEKR